MAEEQLRNIEYVILKNEPSPRSYGQYIFDLFNTANQFPGRNLSESAEDLYTRQEDIHEPSLYKLRRDIGDPERKYRRRARNERPYRSSSRR